MRKQLTSKIALCECCEQMETIWYYNGENTDDDLCDDCYGCRRNPEYVGECKR